LHCPQKFKDNMSHKTSSKTTSIMPYKISLFIHLLVEKICLFLVVALVFSEICIVFLRYIYDIGFLQLHDFALYNFSALVMFSVVYTFGCNKHVRVDVFREKHSIKVQQRVDIIAVVGFLIPFFTLILYWVWSDIVYAWSILEGSRETGGLGGLYLVKSTLPLVCLLMIIQGVCVIIRHGQFLSETPESLATLNNTEVSH
jgi:TRAP-type mannitol/chloroaromatic compound transport system permease small subunit